MTMAPVEKELLNAIHDMDKRVEKRLSKLETKIDDGVNGRFKDLERRVAATEENLKVIINDIVKMKSVPFENKSKWFDEVAKYVLLALVSYLLIKAGIK